LLEVLKLSKDSKVIQDMANMLKQGATLTEVVCPACASPIFRLKSGELWCAKCKKRVIMLKEGEAGENRNQTQMMNLENTVLKKIQVIEEKLKNEEDAETLEKLTSALASLLDTLERLRKIRRT
jgi:UPF0148 protein